jgi:hypothetical protein
MRSTLAVLPLQQTNTGNVTNMPAVSLQNITAGGSSLRSA